MKANINDRYDNLSKRDKRVAQATYNVLSNEYERILQRYTTSLMANMLWYIRERYHITKPETLIDIYKGMVQMRVDVAKDLRNNDIAYKSEAIGCNVEDTGFVQFLKDFGVDIRELERKCKIDSNGNPIWEE